MTETAKDIASLVISAARDKKAYDIVALDLKGISLIADYFVILSGTSTRQTKAIAEEIIKQVKDAGIHVLRREGMESGRWILLDLSSVVVHIFDEETREYYDLERLWSDAPRVEDELSPELGDSYQAQ